MEKKILNFARDLRKAGVPVAVPEITDVLRGLQLVGFAKKRFKSVLKSTLIKEEIDAAVFEKLFYLYFEQHHSTLFDEKHSHKSLKKVSPGAESFLNKVFGHEGRGLGANVRGALRSRLALAVYNDNREEMQKLAREAVQGTAPFKKEDLGDLDQLLYQAKAAVEWFMFTFYLESRREKGVVEEKEYSACQEGLATLEKGIRELLEREIISQMGEEGLKHVLDNQSLRRKEFSRIMGPEEEKIRRQVVKLGKKMATRQGRRKKPGLKGQTDLRNTVRKCIKTGGVPIKLSRKGRITDEPDLLVLCDVSGSVAPFSSFMLLLVHSLQERFRHVRTFLFIDLLSEITDYFKSSDPRGAIQEAMEKAPVSDTNNSDYGRVFFRFSQHHLDLVTSRTVILVLGDAKNNWRSEERLAFKEIAHKARRVFWLNPQPRETWNTRDSVMGVYAPYCHQVMECRNLEQLTVVTKKIFV